MCVRHCKTSSPRSGRCSERLTVISNGHTDTHRVGYRRKNLSIDVSLVITIKDAMIQSNMCSIEDLITNGSTEWDKAAQKLTKRTPMIAVAMKTISKKLKIAEKTIIYGILER